MEKLRIAQVAPVTESVPPSKYGGTQRVVHALTQELVARGHDVTLFASGDSNTSAKLIPSAPISLRQTGIDRAYGLNEWTILNLLNAYSNSDEFDLIHDHGASFVVPLTEAVKTPTVITRHAPFSGNTIELFKRLRKTQLVTVSHDQARGTGIEGTTTVYNGLDMEHYPFREYPGEYILYVARVTPDKGAHTAIDVSRELGIPLILAGTVSNSDLEYFKEKVEPYLSGDIRFAGELDEEERNNLMSNSFCFIHPATFREPFGLTLIESMACGAPVVALKNGSIPEIIIDEVTGFIVSTPAEFARAVLKTQSLSRSDSRKHALTNFNATIMTDRYEAIYQSAALHNS